MHLLIVEDEASVAERIERLTRQVLGEKIDKLSYAPTLAAGMHYVRTQPIDVLLLDLNLNGQDGFSLLKDLVSYSFHTIIISANTHQALEAFEYGVLDFIPKPFTQERLSKAFARYHDITNYSRHQTQYLTVRKKGELLVLNTNDILYIKGSGNYSEVVLQDHRCLLHDKSLNRLEVLLPQTFKRVHRSYICNWAFVKRLINHGAGKHEIELHNGLLIPVSRTKFSGLK